MLVNRKIGFAARTGEKPGAGKQSLLCQQQSGLTWMRSSQRSGAPLSFWAASKHPQQPGEEHLLCFLGIYWSSDFSFQGCWLTATVLQKGRHAVLCVLRERSHRDPSVLLFVGPRHQSTHCGVFLFGGKRCVLTLHPSISSNTATTERSDTFSALPKGRLPAIIIFGSILSQHRPHNQPSLL